MDEAVKAARVAFSRRSAWRKLDPSKKGQLMNKLAKLMKDNISYIAVSLCCIFIMKLTCIIHACQKGTVKTIFMC